MYVGSVSFYGILGFIWCFCDSLLKVICFFFKGGIVVGSSGKGRGVKRK